MIEFIIHSKYAFLVSIILMIVSVILISFKKLNLGIDFTEVTRFDIAINHSNTTQLNVKTLIKLLDQIRMLDNDLIRLQQKVNVVLEYKENEKKKGKASGKRNTKK